MKSIVVGAMLLRTMNAQIPAANAVPAVGLPVALPAAAIPAAAAAVPAAVGAVAPVLTPGINDPSEEDLLDPIAALVPPPNAEPSFALPRGTADVILDQPTPTALFGGGTTPGTGISFGPDGWNFGEADIKSAAPIAPALAAPASNFVAPVQPPALFGGRPRTGFGAFAVPDEAGTPVDEAAPVDAAPADAAATTDTAVVLDAVAADASPIEVLPISSDVAIASPIEALPVSSDAAIASPIEALPVSSDVAIASPIEVVPVSSDAAIASPIEALPVSSDAAIASPIEALPVSSDAAIASPIEVLPISSDVAIASPIEALPVSSDAAIASPIEVLPISSDVPISSETPIASPVDALPVSSDAAIASPIEALPISSDVAIASPIEVLPISSDVPVSSDAAIASPIDALPVSSDILVSSDTPTPTPIVDASPVEASSSASPTPLNPSGIALPIGSNPYIGPFDPYSIYDPNSPYYDPYAQPPGWEGDDNGIYDGEDDGRQGHKRPDYDDDECPAWCLPEDDSYDSYPTPTPDYEYSPYETTSTTPYYVDYTPAAEPYQEYETTPEYAPYPTPTPAYDAQAQYYPEPEAESYPQLKKVRSILRAVRRQVFNWPSAAPQPSYSDDDDSGEYDGEDGSIPDWLYDIDGAPKRPTATPKPKPVCPKSCYKPKTTDKGYGTKPARPTYTKTRKGGYKTTEEPYQTTEQGYYPDTTTDGYYSEPTTDGYYSDETTDAPYAGYTSSVWYPRGNSSAMYWPTGPTNVPDEPTSVPDESGSTSTDDSTSVPTEPTGAPYEPTGAAYEPTTLVTQYQPQPYAAQTGGAWSDPGSPAGDYTGDTLDTLCPNTCNPFNPAENFCDITTGCATTGGSKYYCACRAGFRADNYNAKDFSKQFKVAGQPYVYLAVSTSCNTPCSDQTCSEVLERSQCK